MGDGEHISHQNCKNENEGKNGDYFHENNDFKCEEEFFEDFEMGKKIGEGTNSVVKKCL